MILSSKFFNNLSIHRIDNLLIISIVFLFYAISLFSEVYSRGGGMLGLEALIFGVFSILAFQFFAFVAWCANIFFFIVLFKKMPIRRKRKLISLAVILGLMAIFVKKLPMHMGSTTTAVDINIGYYFWILSIIILFLKQHLKLTEEK